MNTRQKENALNEFIDMIHHAWTWDRMTETERERFNNMIRSTRTKNAVKGGWEARWHILQALFGAFLDGLGYDGPNWREPNPDAVPFC